MNPSTLEAGECTGRRAQARSGSGSPRDNELGERHAGWALEDIDAPEAWTLASFDDLVPCEVT